MVSDASIALIIACLLAAKFHWWLRCSAPVSAADIRLFSRRLSRLVYLVIYLIIGVQQIANIVGGLQNNGVAGQALGMLKPTNQVFLLHGLLALVLIRVLAYLTWRRYRFFVGPRPATLSSAGTTTPSLARPY
jgi:hypothetical protein